MMRRRTQADRSAATIRKLLDATTRALIEVGYARASVMEISRRAGVSHGGLFRHFPSLEALMVAAAEDVGRKLLERYRVRFAALAGKDSPLAVALRLVRETCRSPLNQAWYELAVAARTSPRLRRAIAPLAGRYYAAIGALAAELLPELAQALGRDFGLLVETVVAVFDGEQIHRFLDRSAAVAVEDTRVELLEGLLALRLGQAPAAAARRRRRR